VFFLTRYPRQNAKLDIGLVCFPSDHEELQAICDVMFHSKPKSDVYEARVDSKDLASNKLSTFVPSIMTVKTKKGHAVTPLDQLKEGMVPGKLRGRFMQKAESYGTILRKFSEKL